MFSNARGMAICIGVTGVASILLWFYFKNRIESVETKLDNMFSMIQNFSQPPDSETVPQEMTDYYQQVGVDGVVDPFEQKYGEEVQYKNQNSSPQLPTEIFEKEIENVVNNTKLIEVSEDSGEDSSSEEEGESEDESDGEKEKEITLTKPASALESEEVADSLDEVESEDESEDEKEKELKEEVKEYSHMKVSELKKLAQTQGLTGYTKLNKAGLVNLLENNNN